MFRQYSDMNIGQVIADILQNDLKKKILLEALSKADLNKKNIYVKSKNMEINAASDGLEGINAFHEGEFDLILLDILLRRASSGAVSDTICYKEITVSEAERKVTVSGNEVALTHLEFEILLLFLKNKGRVFMGFFCSCDLQYADLWNRIDGSAQAISDYLRQEAG